MVDPTKKEDAELLERMRESTKKEKDELLERMREAAKRPLTKKEIWEQRVSWVYGNLPHDSKLTREEVEEHLKRRQGV